MCRRWLLRVPRAVVCWLRTVIVSLRVVGKPATDVGGTDSLSEKTSGLSVADDVMIERTRIELHDAIEKHMRVAFPGVISTIDWVVVAENVDEDLNHILHPSVSRDMSSFKLRGMNWEAYKYFSQVTA